MEKRQLTFSSVSTTFVFILITFTLIKAFSYPSKSQTYETIVSSPPVDIFSDRIQGWKTQSVKANDNQFAIQSPLQVMGKVPGIQSRQEGSPTYSIRGSQSSTRLLGLLNGIPLNTADGFGPDELLLPHELISEVQIFKGPASLFYGSDAMGGALNFKTRSFRSTTLRSSIGSYGQRSILLGQPIFKKDDQFLQLSLFNQNYDGHYPYTLNSNSNSGTREASNFSLNRVVLTGEQKWKKFNFKQIALVAQKIGASSGSISFPETTQYSNRANLLNNDTYYDLSESLTITNRLSYISKYNEYRTLSTNSESYSNSRRVSSSLGFKKSFNHNTSTQSFVDFDYDDFMSTHSGEHRLNESQYSLGSIWSFPLYQNWLIKPGARFLLPDNHISFSVGFFEELSRLKRWFTYTQGYHRPSLQQKHSQTTSFVGNPDLKPESSEQFELGFSQSFTLDPEKYWNTSSVEFSAFYVNYKNYISYRNLTSTQSTVENTGSANVSGFEGRLSQKLSPFRMEVSYTYTQTENQKKEPITFVPKHQTQLSLSYIWAIIETSLRHTYWDQFYDRDYLTNNLIELKSWHTLDIIFSTVDLNRWRIETGILNVFDHPVELKYDYPEEQRKLYLSVEYEF